MDYESARAKLAKEIYETALFMERLEREGLILSNGHHEAQRISELATRRLALVWHNKDEVPEGDKEDWRKNV